MAMKGKTDFNREAIANALAEIGREARRSSNLPRPSRGGGSGPARGRGGNSNVYRKYDKVQGVKKKKKKSSDDGFDLGDLYGGVMDALKVADVPRSAVQATVSDIATSLGEGNYGEALVNSTLALPSLVPKIATGAADAVGIDAKGATEALYANNKAAKDQLEHTGAGTYLERGLKDAGIHDTWLNNQWVKRGIGFATDVGSDPLTYVGGAGVLAKGGTKGAALAASEAGINALREGEMAARVGLEASKAERLAQIGEALAAKGDTAGAARAAKLAAKRTSTAALEERGVSTVAREAARKEGEALAGKISRGGGISALSKEEMQKTFNTTGGLKFRRPGTGRVLNRGGTAKELTLLPKELTDPITGAGRALKRGLTRNKVAEALTSKLGGANPELKAVLRSGDDARIVQALTTESVIKTANARAEAGLRLLPDAKIDGVEVGKNGLGQRAMDVYTKHIQKLAKKDPEAIIHAIETGDVSAVEGGQAVKDFLHELYRSAEANGVPINQRENYFPRWLTEEAKAARGGTAETGGLGRKAAFEQARQNEKIAEAVHAASGEVIDVADEARIRSAVEEWASQNLPDLPNGYYEKNINKLLPHYVEALTDRVRTQEIVNRLEEQGIVVPAYIQKGGTISRKAADQAAKLLDQAAAAKARGDSAADAAEEAAASAKLSKVLESETKSEAQRAARQESEQAFADMGGVGGIQVSGAATDSIDWSDPAQVDALIGSAIDKGGNATPGKMDVLEEAAAQKAEAEHLAELDAAEAAGQVVNPEAAARMAQADLPPDVVEAATVAFNAPAAKQREAMVAFQDALDRHGLHAQDVAERMAEQNAPLADEGIGSIDVVPGKTKYGKNKGSGAGLAAGGESAQITPLSDLVDRMEQLREAGNGNAFNAMSDDEVQQFRNAFADAYEQKAIEGGVKQTAGGRYSNPERVRREARRLNGLFDDMDRTLESVGLPTRRQARQMKELNTLKGDSADAIKGLKGKAKGALNDIPEPTAAELGVADPALAQRDAIRQEAIDSGATDLTRSRRPQAEGESLPPDTGAMQKPIPKGHTRLYRGEQDIAQQGGTQFTPNLAEAQKHAGPNGRIVEIDVPTRNLSDYNAAAKAGGNFGGSGQVMDLPPEIAANARESLHRGAEAIDIGPAPQGGDLQSMVDELFGGGKQPADIGGPDYNREQSDLARYKADAQAAEHVKKETVKASETLRMRHTALQGAIESGRMSESETVRAMANLADDVRTTMERAANNIPPLRHASAMSGDIVEVADKVSKEAATDNALGALYRSQRTPKAQAIADEATGVFDREAHAVAQYDADALAGIESGAGQGTPALDLPAQPAATGADYSREAAAVDQYTADAEAGIAGGGGQGNPPGAPPEGPAAGGPPPQGPRHPDEVAAAANAANMDRRSFEAGLADTKAKLEKARARGWDTSWLEKRAAIYEKAMTVTDEHQARALQFQADALDAAEQADKLWSKAAAMRGTAERQKSPKFEWQLRQEIDKSMQRLRVDPSLAAPNDVADILNRVSKVNTPEGMKKFLKHYDQALNYIKAWQLATPGFHVRNFMGGMFNNYLAGVDVSAYSRFVRDRHLFMQGKLPEERAAIMRELLPHVGSAQYSAFEVGGLESITRGQRINPLSKNNAWLTGNRKMGGKIEEILRGSLGYDRLLKGRSMDEAVADIVKYHFDYQDLSQFERGTVKRIIPFYTWTRHNLPLQMEMYLQQPGKYARYWQAKQEIEMGQSPEDVVPSYFLNEGFGIHTPFNFGGGDVYLTPDLPFTTTVQQGLPDLSGVDPSRPGTYASALDGYASMMTPLIKTPIERTMNRQFFKGIPFQDKKYEAPTLWAKAPGLNEALRAVGIIDKDGMVTDRDAYTIEQNLPMLGRMRRLGGGSKKDNERQLSSWLSFLGIPLKTNTKYEQSVEKKRRSFANGGTTPNPYKRSY